MSEINIEKCFAEFKRENQLEYREAYKIFLKFVIGGLLGTVSIKLKPYEQSSLPLIKAFLEANKEDPFSDHLGQLWMWITGTYGKPKDGQFFTPDDICSLIGKLIAPKINTSLYKTPEKPLSLHEPCCGSGAMVLPLLKDFHKQDPNMFYLLHLNDLDEVCCMATFIQITLALIHLGTAPRTKLYVTRGNILCYPNGEELMYALGCSEKDVLEWNFRIQRDKEAIKKLA